ncbi:hypothetical protein MAPG_02404 [Magnaporthiopsis poae ATCC 64411]|uniref:Uncharacterized protein n=1 Tax=Magnaporthiopsis poae (strain ATCC 64411 / 73-15) TaxID=644358 RepID=A0A0C4DR98_MAGP6|nr:hypothetical protein MAPG_02404 [Magnaporthiopsis poae ATCC 64411]
MMREVGDGQSTSVELRRSENLPPPAQVFECPSRRSHHRSPPHSSYLTGGPARKWEVLGWLGGVCGLETSKERKNQALRAPVRGGIASEWPHWPMGSCGLHWHTHSGRVSKLAVSISMRIPGRHSERIINLNP